MPDGRPQRRADVTRRAVAAAVAVAREHGLRVDGPLAAVLGAGAPRARPGGGRRVDLDGPDPARQRAFGDNSAWDGYVRDFVGLIRG